MSIKEILAVLAVSCILIFMGYIGAYETGPRSESFSDQFGHMLAVSGAGMFLGCGIIGIVLVLINITLKFFTRKDK